MYMSASVLAGRCSLVGCASAWYSGFDPGIQQQSFVEIGREIFSTAILFLPLIQEWQLSVTNKACALSTGKLPRRLAQEQCGQVN